MPGGAELSTTARTVGITSTAMLAGLVAEVQDLAAAASRGPVEIAWTYTDPTMGKGPAADADRHRAEIASLAEAGVTSLFVSARQRDPAATLDFLAAFGETYLPGKRPPQTPPEENRAGLR